MSDNDVRNDARIGSGGSNHFSLPDGVREWYPEKAGVYKIDIVPYEVTVDDHPTGTKKGNLCYKRPYSTIRELGPNRDSFVSPASFGQPDPTQELMMELKSDKVPDADKKTGYDKHEKQIKSLKLQDHVVYVIIDPDDKSKLAIFSYPKFKFGEVLDKELKMGPDTNLRFWDLVEGRGRTLQVRFEDASFTNEKGTNKFIKAGRIDFLPRPDMDEDDIILRAPNLDKIFNVMPYDYLYKTMHGKGIATREQGEEATPAPAVESRERKSTTTPAPAKAVSTKTPDHRKGARVNFTNSDEELMVGTVLSVDLNEETYSIEDDSDNTHEVAWGSVELTPVPPARLVPETVEAPAPVAAAQPALKVGESVFYSREGDNPDSGIVTEVDGDDITYKNTKGKDKTVDRKFLKPMPVEAKSVVPSKLELSIGAVITWDDGGKEKSGPIAKVHSSGTKVKVGDDWVEKASIKGNLSSKAAPVSAKVTDTSLPVCPVAGGVFGRDCDKFKECDKCAIWPTCEAQQELLNKK